jgi:hypothetical protein
MFELQGRVGSRLTVFFDFTFRYILPTEQSHQPRDMVRLEESVADLYVCRTCFTGIVCCQSCTTKVATRVCLDCTKQNHQPPVLTALQHSFNSNQALASAHTKEVVEEELYCQS